MNMRKPDEGGVETDIAEANVDETREKIGENLRTLGEKLSPENIKQELKTEAKEKVVEAKNAAVRKLRRAKDSALESAGDAGGFLRDNAGPLALIGIGLGWLFVSRRRRDEGEVYEEPLYEEPIGIELEAGAEDEGAEERLTERAQRKLHQGSERVKQAGRGARRKARDAVQRSRTLAEENPLAVGAVAMAAGVGVGMLLPRTHKEDELLGPARDRLLREAKDTAQTIGHTVKDTARQVSEQVTH